MSQPLVLSLHTLPEAPLAAQLAAAAEAGFEGVSLWESQVAREREAGATLAGLRAEAEGRGLPIVQLEVATAWSAADASARDADLPLLDTAAALGARAVLAVTLQPEPLDVTAAAQGFATLCDHAAERGLEVNLEFLPWTGIPDPERALEVVREAGRPNGALLIDTWHWFRSSGDEASLAALPPEVVRAIQLNDAPHEPEENIVDETLHRRLLPGQGDIGLVSLLRRLDAMGISCPIHVEVFSDELRALPVELATERLAISARAVLDEARARRG